MGQRANVANDNSDLSPSDLIEIVWGKAGLGSLGAGEHDTSTEQGSGIRSSQGKSPGSNRGNHAERQANETTVYSPPDLARNRPAEI